jgi:hypothetical protein
VIGLTGCVFIFQWFFFFFVNLRVRGCRTGQVAQGCLSMLQELPIEMVPVEGLENLMTNWGKYDFCFINIVLCSHPSNHSRGRCRFAKGISA